MFLFFAGMYTTFYARYHSSYSRPVSLISFFSHFITITFYCQLVPNIFQTIFMQILINGEGGLAWGIYSPISWDLLILSKPEMAWGNYNDHHVFQSASFLYQLHNYFAQFSSSNIMFHNNDDHYGHSLSDESCTLLSFAFGSLLSQKHHYHIIACFYIPCYFLFANLVFSFRLVSLFI
jgi:hypothetical protein